MEGTMQVKDVMNPKVEFVGPETCLTDIATKMRDLDLGALPIEDGDDLIGIITDRDIAMRVIANGKDPDATPVRDVMSTDMIWCFDDQDVEDAAHLMEAKKVRRLPVLDHEKKLVGILALSDISRKASHELSGEVIEAVNPIQ